jgi:hypothetical protein
MPPKIQAHTCDDIRALSLWNDTPGPACLGLQSGAATPPDSLFPEEGLGLGPYSGARKRSVPLSYVTTSSLGL